MLIRQSSRKIVFARAPKSVRLDGTPSFGVCSGYTDKECDSQRDIGFANDDIYYLEVCLYSQVCTNGHALFSVEPGGAFVCDFSESGFRRIQQMLVEGPSVD